MVTDFGVIISFNLIPFRYLNVIEVIDLRIYVTSLGLLKLLQALELTPTNAVGTPNTGQQLLFDAVQVMFYCRLRVSQSKRRIDLQRWCRVAH